MDIHWHGYKLRDVIKLNRHFDITLKNVNAEMTNQITNQIDLTDDDMKCKLF